MSTNQILKMERELSVELTLERVKFNIKSMLYENAIEAVKAGKFDDLKKLRFEGALQVLEESKDITLREISDLCFWNNIEPQFQLVDKKPEKLTVRRVDRRKRQPYTSIRSRLQHGVSRYVQQIRFS